MDEIQRWLEASLVGDPSGDAREEWLDSLAEKPDELTTWVHVMIVLSETSPWWYDTLVEYARRSRQPNERGKAPAPPRMFTDWCVGVAAGDIHRPRQRGRPPNQMRDQLICMALERYRDRARNGEPISDSEAFALVADAAGLDDSVVAKIWRRDQRRQ